MYIFKALFMTLMCSNLITGRIIHPQTTTEEEISPTQVDDVKIEPINIEKNPILMEEYYEKLKADLMRILTVSFDKEFRYKRSFYPATAGFQWPQGEASNSWRSGSYPTQKPFFISIDSYENSASQLKNKYTYTKNDKKTSGTSTNSPVDQTKMAAGPQHRDKGEDAEKPTWNMLSKKNDGGQPVWALRAYNGKGKGSRFSRASYSETTTTQTPPRKDNEVTDEPAFKEKGYLSNEVPSIPFKHPRTERPGRCTWAILCCCSSSLDKFNPACFLRLGCEEMYLGMDLCRPDYIQIAMDIASTFYEEEENSKK